MWASIETFRRADFLRTPPRLINPGNNRLTSRNWTIGPNSIDRNQLDGIRETRSGEGVDTGLPTEIYIHDLIENVLTVYNSRLTSTGITVDLQFNDLQKLVASKGEMLQIFSNVIANAIDAMRQGGSLKISTRQVISTSGDGIQIIIRDNGTGIKQEHLEKIFEPFFTTKGDLGTGIGLWVTRQLVEKRGGQISVASGTEQGNSGTSITIFIPVKIPISQLGAARV